MRGLVGAFMVVLAIAPATLWAVIEIEPLSSEALEARYRTLIEEMRCPKCQNQNLEDSNSPIAADLRREIRRLLEAGRSDEEIARYMVERYGDFVLYRPPVQENTLLLWYAPGVLLVVGLIVLAVVVRRHRRSQAVDSQSLSAEERRRLALLLDNPSEKTATEKR